MSTQFQIKKGPKERLMDDNGQPLIALEEGCWYLTTNTFELFISLDGVSLEKINNVEDFDSIVNVSTYNNLPEVGKTEVNYVVLDENATYRWDDSINDYMCIGRDYREIEIIRGGTAQR